MKVKIECPYCDGTAVLQKQPKELGYRKDIFKVVEHFYRCEKCKEEFTTTESDTITLIQAHNQYREKYNILFPEEIVAIREQYGLSAARMSEVLGLGINSYGNYEKGEMPVPAMANLIKTAGKPEVFLDFLEDARQHFSDNSYEKVKAKVCALIQETKKSKPFYANLNIHRDSNNFTGYKRTDAGKVAQLVAYLINNSKAAYNNKLKLNKQLFYTDFSHYKHYGRSVTGLSYRAINYGPVPANYDNIFTYLENEQIIVSYWERTKTGGAVEIFTSDIAPAPDVFSAEELDTIRAIIAKFKDISAWEIVDLSHLERAWKELEGERKLISYQEYAFDLVGA